jgi:hypothetical protein
MSNYTYVYKNATHTFIADKPFAHAPTEKPWTNGVLPQWNIPTENITTIRMGCNVTGSVIHCPPINATVTLKNLTQSIMPSTSNSSMFINRFITTLEQQHQQIIIISILFILLLSLLLFFSIRLCVRIMQKSTSTASIIDGKFLLIFIYLSILITYKI